MASTPTSPSTPASPAAMEDLVVVSNRGPLSFRLDGEGRPALGGTGGGLAATMHPLLVGSGATWVSAAMSEGDRRAVAEGLMTEEGLRLVTVQPDPTAYQMAYDFVSNATLWFCHHHLWDLPRRPRSDRRWSEAWDAYRAVNRVIAEVTAETAPERARVLVQDYHLSLVGKVLAELRPDLRTVHFSHTPFADPCMLRALPSPAAGELLAGMAGFGACGFHSRRWEASFRAAYEEPALAAESAAAGARPGEPPRTFVAPLGPDPAAITDEAGSPAVAEARSRIAARVGDCKLIVRVDRVELSKNILRGLWAFEELLETQPAWRGEVTMMVLAYPSREGLAEYLAYRSEVEHTAARVNDTWGDSRWTPILLSIADDRSRSMAALCAYDVLLVNPVRDGMNLVAKEGPLVNAVDGVLVLSREAGAWDELHPAAIGINPFDVSATAAALGEALSLGRAERVSRADALRKLVLGQSASDWLHQQLEVAAAL